jgi:hypothetical protein
MALKPESVAVLVAVLTLVGCGSVPKEEAAGPERAVAATAHPVATRVARDVLLQGGNAADAAVAAGFALAVVEPSMSHLGGRLQILYRSPDGRYRGYDGMTEIPASYAVPAHPVSQGYGTIAIPGVVAGLGRLHAEHGSLPWASLLAEPAAIASDGYELLPGAAERHASGFEKFRDNPGFIEAFVEADGTAYDAGDLLQQPVLAQTIRSTAHPTSTAAGLRSKSPPTWRRTAVSFRPGISPPIACSTDGISAPATGDTKFIHSRPLQVAGSWSGPSTFSKISTCHR